MKIKGYMSIPYVHILSLSHFVWSMNVGDEGKRDFIKILYYFTIFISLLFNSNSLHTFNKILM